MKQRTEENRYVHSANLFRFCKEALKIKHNFEVKVIDQHVGAILGYDPADCSHWKKGKKNIRSIYTIQTIANHFEIDTRAITDIVSGKTSLEESLYEYRGYGPFETETNKEVFTPDTTLINQRNLSISIVQDLLKKANVRSTPVMIPEILSVLPNVTLQEVQSDTDPLVATKTENDRHIIFCNSKEMTPHIRFLIACEIGKILLFPNTPFNDSDMEMSSRINLFALLLLVPSPLLQIATREASVTRDLVQQLAEYFWLNRSLVVARLQDFMIFQN